MAAQILALYQPPADVAAFDAYYYGTHVPLAKHIPGLRSYVTNRGDRGGGRYVAVPSRRDAELRFGRGHPGRDGVA